jgi:hypothetical protein
MVLRAKVGSWYGKWQRPNLGFERLIHALVPPKHQSNSTPPSASIQAGSCITDKVKRLLALSNASMPRDLITSLHGFLDSFGRLRPAIGGEARIFVFVD